MNNPDCDVNECKIELLYHNITNSTEMMIAMNKQSYVETYLGYVLIGIIGFLSNLFVIIILCSSIKLRQKIVNTLIIHQSVVDLLTSAALIGPSHLDGSKPHGLEGLHGNIYCYFIVTKWPLWVLIDISSFSLVFLNIERYVSIVFPIYHHTNVTRKKVITLLPIVWILGLLEQGLGGFGFTVSNGACAMGVSSFQAQMVFMSGLLFLLLHFFLPVLLVLFLYGHMMIRLKTSKRTNNQATTARRDDIMDKAKKNIFKTMLIITICYAVCFAFNSIYTTLVLFGTLDTLAGKCLISLTVQIRRGHLWNDNPGVEYKDW